MLEDNKTSFTLTKNPKNQNRTKHIDVMHYYIWGLVEKRELGSKSNRLGKKNKESKRLIN